MEEGLQPRTNVLQENATALLLVIPAFYSVVALNQSIIVCRVRAGEDLSMELSKVIDETFPTTIREFVDINARCKELITALQADSVSVLDLVELLDKAYEINVEAHDRLGAMQFLPVSRPGSRAGSRAGSRSVSRAGSQVDLTLKNDTPGPPDLSALTADKFAEKETKVDDDCFQFSVIKNPDRLSITWPKAWGEEFLGAAMQNAQRLRNIEEDPTMVDFMVRHWSSINSVYYPLTKTPDRHLVLRITFSARGAIRPTPRRLGSWELLDSVLTPTPVSVTSFSFNVSDVVF